MITTAPASANGHFNWQHQTHFKPLKLKGLYSVVFRGF